MKSKMQNNVGLWALVVVVFSFTGCGAYESRYVRHQSSLCEENPSAPGCQVEVKKLSCQFAGKEVAHGQQVEAFFSSDVDWGKTCTSEVRSCDDGSLSGTAGFADCQVLKPKFDLSLSQITADNMRGRPEVETQVGFMGGGNPQSRGLMTLADGSQWFVGNKQSEVCHYVNNYCVFETNQYYKKSTAGEWTLMGELENLPGVQQRPASLSDGTKIFSYALVSATPYPLQECVLNTNDLNDKTCAPVQVESGQLALDSTTTYLGAAINPKGVRVVWWMTFGPNRTGGQFSYIYTDTNQQWLGPVTTELGTYNDLGFIHPTFVSDDRMIIHGQYSQGDYADPDNFVVRAAWGSVTLGQTIQIQNYPDFEDFKPERNTDVWVDPTSGAVHSLVRNGWKNVYYYQAKPEDLPQAQFALADSFRARFQFSAVTGYLYLAVGGPTEVKVHRFDQDLSQPLSLSKSESKSVPMEAADFSPLTGIYNSASAYSVANDNKRVAFGLCGSFGVRDNEIWELLIKEI